MSSPAHFIVVVGTDFSPMAGLAVDHALELAARRDGSEVHVVYVRQDTPGPSETSRDATADQVLAQVRINAADHVARLAAVVDTARIRAVVAHVREGSAPEAIAQLAADLHADLVVVGTHGHSEVARFFLGSVADRVARLARCAVSIVRPKAHLDADDVPKIEPPCPDCLAARAETNGATMWCARHAEHHVRAHAYAYRSTGLHSAEAEEFAPIG